MCSEQVIDKLEKKIIFFFWNWKNFIVFFSKSHNFPKNIWQTFPPFNRHKTCMLLLSIVENDWWVERYFLKSSELDILFSSNHNIHKSSCGLCFWASDTLINWFYKKLLLKGSEAQKQSPHDLLWMLWFDKKKYI